MKTSETDELRGQPKDELMKCRNTYQEELQTTL